MIGSLIYRSSPIVLAASAAVGVFVGSDLASAQGKARLKCGDTITKDTMLRRDLDCSQSNVSFGLTVRGPATLDLDGNSVLCDEAQGVCVILVGEGARLKGPGLVSGGGGIGGNGVEVAGDGGHTVHDVRAHGAEASIGIAVVSDGNHLERNSAGGDGGGIVVTGDANILDGNTSFSLEFASFIIAGTDNLLTRNTAELFDLTSAGIRVAGPNNRLINNIVRLEAPGGAEGIQLVEGAASTTVLANSVVEAEVGIAVDTDRNLIVANEARDNVQAGIRLAAGAESNVVLGNQARANGGFDLVDANQDCDANLWVANQFDDVNQACVALSLGTNP